MKISYRSTTMNVISKPNLVELLLTAKSFQYLKVKNFSDLPGWFCPFILSVELYDCQWVIYKIIKKRIFFFFFLKWSNCNNIHWNFQWEFSLICVLWQGSLLSSHRKIGWKFKGVFAIVIRVSGWEDYWNMYFRYKTMRNGDGPYL